MRKLIFILAVLVGCSTTQVDIDPNHGTITDLDSALDLWAQSEPDSYEYSMEYIDGSGCTTHKFVTSVTNGRTESRSSQPIAASCGHVYSGVDAAYERPEPHLVAGMTVTDLLRNIVLIDCPLVEAHTRELKCPRDGALFVAQYHPEFGFPISFHYFYGTILEQKSGQYLKGQRIRYDFGYEITQFQIRK